MTTITTSASTGAVSSEIIDTPSLKAQLADLLKAKDGFEPPIFTDVGITPEWMEENCSAEGAQIFQFHRAMAKVAMSWKGEVGEVAYIPNVGEHTGYPTTSLRELTVDGKFFNVGIILATSDQGDPYNLAFYLNGDGEAAFLRIAPTCLDLTASSVTRDDLLHMMNGVDTRAVSLREQQILLPDGMQMLEIGPEEKVSSNSAWIVAHARAKIDGLRHDFLCSFCIEYVDSNEKKGHLVFFAERNAVKANFFHYGESYWRDLFKKFTWPDSELRLTRAQAVEHANRQLWLLNRSDYNGRNNPVVICNSYEEYRWSFGHGASVRQLGVWPSRRI